MPQIRANGHIANGASGHIIFIHTVYIHIICLFCLRKPIIFNPNDRVVIPSFPHILSFFCSCHSEPIISGLSSRRHTHPIFFHKIPMRHRTQTRLSITPNHRTSFLAPPSTSIFTFDAPHDLSVNSISYRHASYDAWENREEGVISSWPLHLPCIISLSVAVALHTTLFHVCITI